MATTLTTTPPLNCKCGHAAGSPFRTHYGKWSIKCTNTNCPAYVTTPLRADTIERWNDMQSFIK